MEGECAELQVRAVQLQQKLMLVIDTQVPPPLINIILLILVILTSS